MSDNDQTSCFTAFCKCGGWIGTAVDKPEYANENAKSVGRWMRAGYRIEKVPVCDIRSSATRMCDCPRTNKRNKQKEMF